MIGRLGLTGLLLLYGVLPAVAQTTKFDNSIGFSSSGGSLPPWTKPSDESRQQLGEFVRKAGEGVMLVGSPKVGQGTAWVVSKKHRLLATNAHVADIQNDAGGKLLAIISGRNTVYTVDKIWYHPGVRRFVGGGRSSLKATNPKVGPIDPACPDLAVLHLAEGGDPLPVELEMASADDFEQLLAQSVGILGFPGYDTTTWPGIGETVQASFHDGVISRFTDFHNSISAPLDFRQYIQYTVSTWSGFSGSPILLPNGRVIAVHNSARTVTGAGGQVQALPHGVRIDCLWELAAHHGLNILLPPGLDPETLKVKRWLEDDPADIALQKAMQLVREANDIIVIDENFTEGVARCSEALKLAPDYAPAYHARSLGRMNYYFKYKRQLDHKTVMDQLVRAETDAVKYASLNPSDPWGLLRLSSIYNNAGHYLDEDSFNQKSLQIATKLLESENLTTEIKSECHKTRGVAYGNLDRDELAQRDYADSIRLNPKEPANYATRADYWRSIGRTDLADADMAIAKRLRDQMRENRENSKANLKPAAPPP